MNSHAIIEYSIAYASVRTLDVIQTYYTFGHLHLFSFQTPFFIKIIYNTCIYDNMTTPPHFRDENDWEPIPESEIDRLQQTLYPHLRKMKISSTKPQRIQFVKELLKNQNNTCAFGKNVGGKYCWNEPKDSDKKYLKLQWGHIKPRCRKDETQTIKDLCLLCARCNNQIQTSRYLCQLKAELESKLKNIDELIQTFK